jgi:hypothetical protein
MKTKVAMGYLATAMLGLAMSAGAVAQARHDEKPHGESAKHVKKSDVKKQPHGTGTRHDEKPHAQSPKAEGEKK